MLTLGVHLILFKEWPIFGQTLYMSNCLWDLTNTMTQGCKPVGLYIHLQRGFSLITINAYA